MTATVQSFCEDMELEFPPPGAPALKLVNDLLLKVSTSAMLLQMLPVTDSAPPYMYFQVKPPAMSLLLRIRRRLLRSHEDPIAFSFLKGISTGNFPRHFVSVISNQCGFVHAAQNGQVA